MAKGNNADWRNEVEYRLRTTLELYPARYIEEAVRIAQSEDLEEAYFALRKVADAKPTVYHLVQAISFIVNVTVPFEATLGSVTDPGALAKAIRRVLRDAPYLFADPATAKHYAQFIEEQATTKRPPGSPASRASQIIGVLSGVHEQLFKKPLHAVTSALLRATFPDRGEDAWEEGTVRRVALRFRKGGEKYRVIRLLRASGMTKKPR